LPRLFVVCEGMRERLL